MEVEAKRELSDGPEIRTDGFPMLTARDEEEPPRERASAPELGLFHGLATPEGSVDCIVNSNP